MNSRTRPGTAYGTPISQPTNETTVQCCPRMPCRYEPNGFVLQEVGVDPVNYPPNFRVIPVPCQIPDYGAEARTVGCHGENATARELRALQLQVRRPGFERIYNPDTERMGAIYKMYGNSADRRPTTSYEIAERNQFIRNFSRVKEDKYMKVVDPPMVRTQRNDYY